MTKRTQTPAQVGIESPWLTVSEASAYARLSEKTIGTACRDGSLRATQRVEKGKWLIHRSALDDWLEGSVA